MTTSTDTQPPTVRAAQEWDTSPLDGTAAEELQSLGTHDADTAEVLAERVDLLARCVASRGALAGIDAFLASADDFDECCDRYATVRTLEIVDGAVGEPTPWPGWAPPNPTIRWRPLRPLELGLLRRLARPNLGSAALVSLLEAGCASGEMPHISINEIRPVDDHAVSVAFPGAGRAATPRTVSVTGYPASILRRALEEHRPGPIGYCGTQTLAAKIQSSQLMVLGKVLADSGLKDDPTVKPMSIRNGAMRRLRDERGIEAAAVQMGYADLKKVSQELNLCPRPPSRRRSPILDAGGANQPPEPLT